jgi:hypothetical protein
VFERGSAVDTLNNARPIAANNFLSKDAKWSAPLWNTLGVASLCVTCKNSVWSSCQMKGQFEGFQEASKWNVVYLLNVQVIE